MAPRMKPLLTESSQSASLAKLLPGIAQAIFGVLAIFFGCLQIVHRLQVGRRPAVCVCGGGCRDRAAEWVGGDRRWHAQPSARAGRRASLTQLRRPCLHNSPAAPRTARRRILRSGHCWCRRCRCWPSGRC